MGDTLDNTERELPHRALPYTFRLEVETCPYIQDDKLPIVTPASVAVLPSCDFVEDHVVSYAGPIRLLNWVGAHDEEGSENNEAEQDGNPAIDYQDYLLRTHP